MPLAQPMALREVASPYGPIQLSARSGRIGHIQLPGSRDGTALRDEPVATAEDEAALDQAERELGEYFAGERDRFTFPVAIEGTGFQVDVWRALQDIPYGETRSYGDIAMAIGRPGAARAVGQANRRNHLPIVVPCHRVVASDGALGGYMGEWRKEGGIKADLLKLEGAWVV